MDFVVTTTRKNQEELKDTAQRWARVLRLPFVSRGIYSMDDLLEDYEAQGALLATKEGPKVFSQGHKFAYHPSMAQLRVENIKKGQPDHLVEAMGLKPGMRVLDCTLGLAADAAVASFVVGPEGKVVGLEGSPLLHFTVQLGLKNYEAKDPDLTAALRRITAVRADAAAYLASRLEEYDVVYFDPMFETPVKGSSNMEPLRALAYTSQLTREVVDLALQRAPRVVIKERYAKYLKELGCKEIVGGKYSSFKYGIRYR